MESKEERLGVTQHNFGNDDIVILTGKKGTFDTVCGASYELEEVEQYLRELQLPERTQKYIGLSNQGATCYLNSLI